MLVRCRGRQAGGRVEFNINTPGALGGLEAVADLGASAFARVIVSWSFSKVGAWDEFELKFLSRKLAVIVTGSGRAFITNSRPFLRSIGGGTLSVLRLKTCS